MRAQCGLGGREGKIGWVATAGFKPGVEWTPLDLVCAPRVLVAETTSQQERLQAIAVSSSLPLGRGVEEGWGRGPRDSERRGGGGQGSDCFWET